VILSVTTHGVDAAGFSATIVFYPALFPVIMAQSNDNHHRLICEYSPRGDVNCRVQQPIVLKTNGGGDENLKLALEHELNRLFPRWQKPTILGISPQSQGESNEQ
jgi:hypothetical protein